MTIFAAGAHGVGKTYLAKSAAQKVGLVYATASQLIRSELGEKNWDGEKRVANIDDNQQALIRAVSRLKAQGSGLLLDGHFVLRNADGHFEPVPEAVFRELSIHAVLLIQAPSDLVAARLRERGDSSWTKADIENLSRLEAEQAALVCKHISVPLLILDSPQAAEFEAALASVIEHA